MSRIILSDYDKKRNKNINMVKRGIRNLELMGYKIEEQLTETMMGTVVGNIYAMSYFSSGTVEEQKFIFTIRKEN